MKPVRNSH